MHESNRARKRREMEEAGERYVQFVVNIDLWKRFLVLCCAEEKPNRVFTRMIEKSVKEHEGSSTAKV